MKYIKDRNLITESTKGSKNVKDIDIHKFMRSLHILDIDYKIVDDGIISEVDVIIEKVHLNKNNEIPFTFYKVNGDFDCSGISLSSLKNTPRIITGNFDCSYNDLESLEFGPIEIGNLLDCSNNELKSIDHHPRKCKEIDCSFNKIELINSLPSEIKYVDCMQNKILYISYLLINEEMNIYFNNNPIEELIEYIRKSLSDSNFDKEIDNSELLERIEEFDVIEKNNIYMYKLDMLIEFYSGTIKTIIKGYNVIES